MIRSLIVLLAIATIAYSQVPTPGTSCHACGYCSTPASPWEFDYDWSTFGNETTSASGGQITYMASPCGAASGLSTYILPPFNQTSCNATTHMCYCTPDFGRCISYGYEPTWSIISHNAVVLRATNPERCRFDFSNPSSFYEVVSIFACDRLAKQTGGKPFADLSQPTNPWRAEFCTASPTYYCSRCMLWLTPLACKDPATLNVTSVGWNAQTRLLSVNFTATNVIPQIGTEAAYTLFINNQQWNANFTTTSISVTLPAGFGNGGVVTVRMLVFETDLFDDDHVDATPSHTFGTPETTTGAPANNGVAILASSFSLVLMCLIAYLL